jgi:hypothetical protein
MPNLEYSESIPKCGCGKIHNCKICPYVTKSLFYVVSDLKRHGLPLESSRCERNDLEKYFCKDCNFETDLLVILKQHFREYHRKDTDCMQDQPKNDAVVESYICQTCSFATYSVLLWMKHLESSCFNTEEECENVRAVSCSDEQWYRCECCSFKTKEATVLERHQTVNHSLHQKEIFRCFHCKYKGKNKNYLKKHINYKHATLKAEHRFHCNECQFTSNRYSNMQYHKKLQHSAVAIKWYNCDKCEYKTKHNSRLKKHKAIHLSADAVQWHSCDKCEFKTKYKKNLKQHKKMHLSADAIQ